MRARKGDGSLPDPDLAAGRLIAVVLVRRIDAQFEEGLDATDAVRWFHPHHDLAAAETGSVRHSERLPFPAGT